MSAPAAEPHGACRNCGSALTDLFCAHCGQSAEVHVPSTKELVHEVLEGLTHSDSRLWRTLKMLWFKPGQLTQEFVAGRRVAYLPPFRLYLIMSVVFFLGASLLPGQHFEFIHFDSDKAPEQSCSDINSFSFFGRPDWNTRIQRACLEVLHDNGENLQHVFVATMPKAMFVFLPLMACLNMLMYWWPRHRYAEHLLFFLHFNAFFFSVMTLMLLLSSVGKIWPAFHAVGQVLTPVIYLTLLVYLMKALKRYFKRSWFGTLVHGGALLLVYMIVFELTVTGVFVYAALQL